MQAEKWLSATEAVAFGIADRVIDPARRAAAKATKKIVARARPQESAMARWRAAVDAKAATMPRAKAVSAVDKEHPDLRLAMIREANRR